MGKDAEIEWTAEELIVIDRFVLCRLLTGHDGWWKMLQSIHPDEGRGVNLESLGLKIKERMEFFIEKL